MTPPKGLGVVLWMNGQQTRCPLHAAPRISLKRLFSGRHPPVGPPCSSLPASGREGKRGSGLTASEAREGAVSIQVLRDLLPEALEGSGKGGREDEVGTDPCRKQPEGPQLDQRKINRISRPTLPTPPSCPLDLKLLSHCPNSSQDSLPAAPGQNSLPLALGHLLVRLSQNPSCRIAKMPPAGASQRQTVEQGICLAAFGLAQLQVSASLSGSSSLRIHLYWGEAPFPTARPLLSRSL